MILDSISAKGREEIKKLGKLLSIQRTKAE